MSMKAEVTTTSWKNWFIKGSTSHPMLQVVRDGKSKTVMFRMLQDGSKSLEYAHMDLELLVLFLEGAGELGKQLRAELESK